MAHSIERTRGPQLRSAVDHFPRRIWFSKPGWWKRYLRYRAQHPWLAPLPPFPHPQNPEAHEAALYALLQPTGLFYGLPLHLPRALQLPLRGATAEVEGVYGVFLDALFSALLVDRQMPAFPPKQASCAPNERCDVAQDAHGPAVEQIIAEYFLGGRKSSFSAIARKLRNLGRRAEHVRIRNLEQQLRARLTHRGFLRPPPIEHHDGLAFLSLHACRLWQQQLLQQNGAALPVALNKNALIQELQQEEEELAEALIRVLIASCEPHDETRMTLQQRLLERHLRSARLRRGQRAALRTARKQGLSLDAIPLPQMSWILRRFFLDAALMVHSLSSTLHTQGTLREPHAAEQNRFPERLAQRLSLPAHELEESLLALERFRAAHEASLAQLMHHSPWGSFRRSLRIRWNASVERYLEPLVKEIQETRELYQLLRKSAHTPLNQAEKDCVRAQLLDLLKTVPALMIFSLPGGLLLLPIAIKVLPFNLLPSSFED